MATTNKSSGRKASGKAARGTARGDAQAATAPSVAHGLGETWKALTGQVMGLAGAAMSGSLNAAGGLLPKNVASGARGLLQAGSFLRQVREGAGLSMDELAHAVDLQDGELLAAAETGKLALPFEVILRLAAVLARNDPIPFVTNLTKAYSPALWSAMDAVGIGRLVEHAGREHEFVAIYRARDAARRLSDDEFARVKKFVEAAFDLALAFAEPPAAPLTKRPPARRN